MSRVNHGREGLNLVFGYLMERVDERGPRATFEADTCPEREVLFRIWDHEGNLITYEMSPEEAIRLAKNCKIVLIS